MKTLKFTQSFIKITLGFIFLILITFNGVERAAAEGINLTGEQDKLPAVNLLCNGNPMETDVPPILESGTVLAPVRAVAEKLGAKVQWDSETQSVSIEKPGKKITFRIDSSEVKVNDVAERMNIPAKIISSTTMVPVRFISEALGAKVSWDNATYTVNIIFEESDTAGNVIDEVKVIQEIPTHLEGNNPIAMVLTWDVEDRTIYYFNWGMKNSGGYALEYLGLEGSLIKVMAVSPAPGSMVTQALTYPRLILSLPKGEYTYKVVNEQGEVDFPDNQNQPLAFKVPVPGSMEDGYLLRSIYRDPYLDNEGKTTGQIYLEALFAQPELTAKNYKVRILGVSFAANNWVVLLSDDYNDLTDAARAELEYLIKETLLLNPVKQITGVKITTDSTELPPLEN